MVCPALQYLDGPEVDCDLVFSEGVAVYGAVTDNWPTVEPYFNETGSNCPSILPRQQQKELLELSVNCVKVCRQWKRPALRTSSASWHPSPATVLLPLHGDVRASWHITVVLVHQGAAPA